MSIRNWPEQQRPREKLLQQGPNSLSDSELLAIFLRTGVSGKSAVQVAQELINQCGSLGNLLTASQTEFCRGHGLGTAKFAQLQAVLEMSRRYLLEEVRQPDALTSPDKVRKFLIQHFRALRVEVFGCLYLNTQNQIIEFEELFSGTLDSAAVYPREVAVRALEASAKSVILVHNHPSGNPEPSRADIEITERLKSALALLEIRVLDHIIIAQTQMVSLAERGYC